jgi:hypothetical protein
VKPLLVISATLVALVVIWISYDLVRSRSCEELLEQSTPSLHASLAFLQSKGEVTLGRTQVRALAEGADRLNAQLKGCCVSRQKNYIGNDEYESCLRRAQAYEGKVRDVKKSVEQARDATASRDPNRANEYAARAQELARIALGSVIAIENAPPVATSPPSTFPPATSQRSDAAIGGGPRPSVEPETDAAEERARQREAGHEHVPDAEAGGARD